MANESFINEPCIRLKDYVKIKIVSSNIYFRLNQITINVTSWIYDS